MVKGVFFKELGVGFLKKHGLYQLAEEEDYCAAMLVFYELNSIVPMKKIFIEQYEFAARNYAVK